MLRIAGALLFILVIGYLCLVYAREEERRVGACEGALLLVRHLHTRIEVGRDTVAAALASFENAALDGCGFLSVARERGLGRALSELGDRALPDGEVRRALSELAQRIEGPTLREAVFACEEAEGVLAAAFVKRKSELPARVKAGRALIVFFGLTVLLLLG